MLQLRVQDSQTFGCEALFPRIKKMESFFFYFILIGSFPLLSRVRCFFVFFFCHFKAHFSSLFNDSICRHAVQGVGLMDLALIQDL